MVYTHYQDEALGALQQFMSEVKRTPPLTAQEEEQLLLTIKSDRQNVEARDRLIAGYLPLLIGLAKRFARNCKQLDLLDLVQEGNLGLLQALEKYDASNGEASFRTFAFSWARTVMLTAFWQYERAIRFPLHKMRAIRQMGIVNTRLLSELGREPTIAETALAFFDACDTGKGWEGCRAYCEPNATFAAQAEPLTDVRTLEAYTDWMKALIAGLGPT